MVDDMVIAMLAKELIAATKACARAHNKTLLVALLMEDIPQGDGSWQELAVVTIAIMILA